MKERWAKSKNGLRGVEALTVIDLSHTPIRVNAVWWGVCKGEFEG